MIFLCTDGVHDNFDPETLGLTPQELVHFFPFPSSLPSSYRPRSSLVFLGLFSLHLPRFLSLVLIPRPSLISLVSLVSRPSSLLSPRLPPLHPPRPSSLISSSPSPRHPPRPSSLISSSPSPRHPPRPSSLLSPRFPPLHPPRPSPPLSPRLPLPFILVPRLLYLLVSLSPSSSSFQ
jgi:hypothetical protein